jgi:hypothetical protein
LLLLALRLRNNSVHLLPHLEYGSG